MKKSLLILFSFSFLFTWAQNNYVSSIDSCNEFVSGPNLTWTHVLVATTIADGYSSQAAQTYSMNVTSLPAGGANVRVYKTIANGNDFFGNPVALTLGSNSITVPAVTFDRAVKFQFSSGDVEFDALSLNGVDTECVVPLPPPPFALISDCDDFVSGPTAWPYVLIATTIADGASSQAAQTYTMNVTSLPVGGANVRVYKTTANGNDFFGNPVALTLGSNSITVPAVTFDRAVKFQFSSGDVEFDALSLNGIDTECICISTTSTDLIVACDNYTWIDGNTYFSSNNSAIHILVNNSGCDSVVTLDLTITTSTYVVDIVEACDSYTWIDGNTYTTSNNSATYTLVSASGCDSVVTLDLTITTSSFGTDIIEACDSYTWIDGNTYTTSNNSATYTLVSASGCDSIVTLDLTITFVDATVIVMSDSSLQAQFLDTGTSYQWVDCNNNFAVISGETNSIFTTQITGDYAVEVTINNCSALSNCYNISNNVNVDVYNTNYAIQLFPNPTKNDLTVSLEGVKYVDIVIFDIHGKAMLEQSYLLDRDNINISSLAAGTYFVKIITSEESKIIRISKH